MGPGERVTLEPGGAAALGEGLRSSCTRASVLLGTGGGVTAMALAPAPRIADEGAVGGLHYLAVGVTPSKLPELHQPGEGPVPGPASVQVWKLRPEISCGADGSEDVPWASCSYSFSHQRGNAMHMEFCPPMASSSQENLPKKQKVACSQQAEAPSIGRLAALFRDGTLALWDLTSARAGGAHDAFTDFEPAATSDYITSTMETMPLRLAWRTAKDVTEIAVTCSNGTVVIFRVQEAPSGAVGLRVVSRIAVDAHPLRCILWLPESRDEGTALSTIFVTGGVSGKLFVIDTRAPDLPLGIFPCGKGFVEDVSCSPHFNGFASAHEYGLLRLWDLSKAKRPYNCEVSKLALKSLAPASQKPGEDMTLFCTAGGAVMRIKAAREGTGQRRKIHAAPLCLGALEWVENHLKVHALPDADTMAGCPKQQAESDQRKNIQWVCSTPCRGPELVSARGRHSVVFGCRGGLVWWQVVSS